MTDERRSKRRTGQVNEAITVLDFLDHLAETTEGTPFDQIKLSRGAFFSWESPETDEELEARLKHEQLARERNEKWERDTLTRLQAKYSGASNA